MNAKRPVFWGGALLLALALAILVSPVASRAPDGLEKFAQERHLPEAQAAWKHAPMPDYKVEGLKSETLGTSVAGATGTLAAFGVMLGLAYWLARKPATNAGKGAE